MPPQMTAAVAARTRNLFRSEKLMIALSTARGGGSWWLGAAAGGGHSRGPRHFLDRLAELALGIEHELAGRHDPLARLHTGEHLIESAGAAGAELDRARREGAVGERDEHGVLLAAAQHRHLRHQRGVARE